MYISIPYGAIKRHNYHLLALANLQFQFLMVRLKVGQAGIKFRGRIHISIPYGAIKSYRISFSRIFPICISIPYGAIKSLSILLKSARVLHFNSLWCD